MPDGLTYTLQQLNAQHDIVILVSNISIIPNPVRPNQRARVAYELPIQMDVKIIITSMQGKTIRVENLGNRKAGKYTYQLDPTGLASGMYNCTFLANGARVTKRFIVTR